MVTIPPRHFCVIANPALRQEKKDPTETLGDVVVDEYGMVVVRHGEEEVRVAQEPFPLYPGEVARGIKKLQTVYQNKALRLEALQDLVDDNGTERVAGEQWLFEGPGTYVPRVDVKMLKREKALVVKENTALKLFAVQDTVDRFGNKRIAGEEWLVDKVGAYLPGTYEKFVEMVKAKVLTDKRALHLRAKKTFVDRFGTERKCGEEWLLTNKDIETYIPGVHEELTAQVAITTLTNNQFCVIQDPFDEKTGTNKFGEQQLVRGETSFFLKPNEKLLRGVRKVHVLSEEEGLILTCLRMFEDDSNGEVVVRQPGERWTIRGPMEYCPPVDVKIVKHVQAIPLDQNEGIYVQNMKNGEIRAVIGETYMLTEEEELYEKHIEPLLENLLFSRVGFAKVPAREMQHTAEIKRDRTKVVSYRVSHNTAVQIYDFKKKTGRVVFGPDMVLLGPEEEFTLLSLSGDVPKKPNHFKTVQLMLGPDYFKDEIVVETSDHARLKLGLSYNWFFKVDHDHPEKLFNVSDFVGDACKAVASRIRGAVARVNFDDFHKNSAKLIRVAVFGRSGEGEFLFPANGLVITGIDIKSVDPMDRETKKALQKSVQIAIEITTNAQKAKAEHEAERKSQAATGKLQRQQLNDNAEAERSKTKLAQIKAETEAVKTTGLKVAQAKSESEAALISWQAKVEAAQLDAEARTIELESELMAIEAERNMELELMKSKYDLEATHLEATAEIETAKFEEMVNAIGPDTIKAMALAGPEMQAKLLSGLGIESTLIMDGSSPINLFTTASGFVGGPQA